MKFVTVITPVFDQNVDDPLTEFKSAMKVAEDIKRSMNHIFAHRYKVDVEDNIVRIEMRSK